MELFSIIQLLFDKDYKNATLETTAEIANESVTTVLNIKLSYQLYSTPENRLICKKEVALDASIASGATYCKTITIPVSDPKKWDPEHPNLYDLRLEIIKDNKVIETLHRNVGFRQIEVRGNQVFVNNTPIKLKGVLSP